MDLDELASAIKQASSDPVASKLSRLLSAWKDDQSDVKELENTVERYLGNTWIAKPAEHEEIYSLWSRFRDDAMHAIQGRTMNERLYYFSLFPRWDSAQSDEDRKKIYAKLLANR